MQANRFYEPDGRIITIPTLADYTFSFYGEYGFTDRLTGIAYKPGFSPNRSRTRWRRFA